MMCRIQCHTCSPDAEAEACDWPTPAFGTSASDGPGCTFAYPDGGLLLADHGPSKPSPLPGPAHNIDTQPRRKPVRVGVADAEVICVAAGRSPPFCERQPLQLGPDRFPLPSTTALPSVLAAVCGQKHTSSPASSTIASSSTH